MNSPWNTIEQLEAELPDKVKRILAEKNATFYNIDASRIAYDQGLGQRINMIMQVSFYFMELPIVAFMHESPFLRVFLRMVLQEITLYMACMCF